MSTRTNCLALVRVGAFRQIAASCLRRTAPSLWMMHLVATAAAAQPSVADLKKLSLEDLMNVEVISVAKREQRLADAASAIFALTEEDIRRSGATTLPELLRMVPGLHVARIDGNKWAVSSRGFNGRFANKMLVLIDGRSIYTPLFAGVYWDIQDLLIEDVERIEVIRGPGATLWGANAVNGVINVLTKSSAATQGTLFSGGSGTEERGLAAVRYGGSISSRAQYRVFGKYFNRDLPAPAAPDPADAWELAHGGFRVDSTPSSRDQLMVQGALYTGTSGQTFTRQTAVPIFDSTFDDEATLRGGNILAKWSRSQSASSQFALQMYFDRTRRKDALLGEVRNTYDIDFQHRQVARRQDIVWGLGYRISADALTRSAQVSFNPLNRSDDLFSLFVEDELALHPQRLRLTVGSKFEHNDYTGWEVQPNARLLWVIDAKQTFWASTSRAVRIPSRADSDVQLDLVADASLPFALGFPSPLPVRLSVTGNPAFQSEIVYAQEAGYRVQANPRLSFDIATFYNRHDRLRGATLGSPRVELGRSGPHLVVPLVFNNRGDGESYGAEIAGSLVVAARWQLTASFAHHEFDLSSVGGAATPPTEDSPANRVRLQSYLTLPANWELDAGYEYVGKLPILVLPGYGIVNLRLGWRPTAGLGVSALVSNLFDNHHYEFRSTLGEQTSQLGRQTAVRVSWAF